MTAPDSPDQNHIDSLIAEGRLAEAQMRFRQFLEACEAAADDLIRSQSRLSKLTDDENQGIENGNFTEYNRILWAFSTQVNKFRREVLSEYFDVRDREDYLKHISDRDTVIRDILALRIQPKNFYIEDLIVEGNSSLVYRLFNPILNRHAIALVLKIPKLTPQAKQEIEGLVDLRHRNLIKLVDYDLSSYPFFVITEFVYGTTLLNALETTGPRPISQAADWLYQLTDALDYLRHKRIFHTNVRPSKIYVDDEWQIMVSPLDMHSVCTGEYSYNRFLDVVKYGSPEALAQFTQIHTQPKEQDSWKQLCISDQYSLGLLGYKILTSQDLFEGATVYDLMESRQRFEQDKSYRKSRLAALPKADFCISDGKKVTIGNIFEKLLQKDPDKRYGSLHQVLRAFHPFTRTKYNDQSLARNSYRRSLASNKEFIRDFYSAFFQKVPDSEMDFNPLSKKRQLAMLQMAVDVLLDVDAKQHHLMKIMGKAHHQKYALQDFEHFIDILIETVRRNDPLFDKATAEEWQILRHKTLQFIHKNRAE